MRLRNTIAASLMLVPICLGSVGCRDRRPEAPPEAPDLVLVVVDTLRADHLPMYGYARPTAPNLSAMAARGWVFERALAHASWTLPSVASMLTGRLPHAHGLAKGERPEGHFGVLDADVTTLAEILAGRGYRTAAFVNNPFLAPDFGLSRGFDRYDYAPASNHRIRSASETVAAALAWLNKDDRPAFVLVHLMEPHLDYAPQEDVLGVFAEHLPKEVGVPFTLAKGRALHHPTANVREAVMALYDEEILSVDRALGALVDGLGDRGRTDRTWMWITSDHGEEFWDHGGFEHGHQLHDEIVRIPLVAVGPHLEPRRVSTAVSHSDLFQSLVDLGGATAPAGTRGRSLVGRAFDGPEHPVLSEDCLYGPQQLAVSLGRYRATVRWPDRTVEVGTVGAVGEGDVPSDVPAEVASRLRGLATEALRVRGEALPAPVAEPDPLRVEELRSLGYVQ